MGGFLFLAALALAPAPGIVSAEIAALPSENAVRIEVVVTNAGDRAVRASLSGVIRILEGGQTHSNYTGNAYLASNALNAELAAEGGIVLAGERMKLKPFASKRICLKSPLGGTAGAAVDCELDLGLYSGGKRVDSVIRRFRPEKAIGTRGSDPSGGVGVAGFKKGLHK